MAYHKPVNLNSSTFTLITAVTRCRSVILQEPLLAASTAAYQASPTDTSAFASIPAGVPIQFTPTGEFWNPGDQMGQVKLATGSLAFDQVEQ